MPIYRYDSNGYANDGTPEWRAVRNFYRFNNSIAAKWQTVKSIWRYDANGYSNDGIPEWRKVHSAIPRPEVSTLPTLRNATNTEPDSAIEASLFKGGNVVTLTRGSYTNTTGDANTKYTMQIVRSINLETSIANWEIVSGPTIFYGNTSNASTGITYTVTDDDAKGGYYIGGRIRVDTDPSDINSPIYNFPIVSAARLSKVSHTVDSLTTSNVTDNDVTFTWSVGGITDSTYIHSQTLKIRSGSTTGPDVISPITIPSVNTRVYTVTDSPGLSTNTTYYGRIEVVANDGWKTSTNPTLQVRNVTFQTTGVLPVNTIAPTVTPLNSRGYAPRGVQLTCSTGTWTNVNASTVYSYQWQYYEDAGVLSGYRNMTESGNTSNIFVIPTSSTYATKVRCRVTAKNGTDPGVEAFATWGDLNTNVDPAVSIGAISVDGVSPPLVQATVSKTYNFSISGYPTQYTINWGDGTSAETYSSFSGNTISQSRAHTYATTGSKTITITAQPGNVQSTTTVTVNPLLGSIPTPSGVTYNSGTQIFNVTFSATGTGPYYQLYWNQSGFAPANTTYYDAASTSLGSIFESLPVTSPGSWNFWLRSSNQNLGNTTLNGNATLNTFTNWSSTFVTYTATAPSGGSASISGTGAQSSNLTLSKTDATGNPATTATWVWRRNDGGTSGGTFAGGTIVQTNGTTYTVQAADIGYKIRAEVTWSNGVLPNQVVITNEITTLLSYSITWDAAGGTNGIQTTGPFVSGTAHTAPDPGTRAGFQFSFWRTPAVGELVATRQPGQTYTPTQNTNFAAIWTTPSYTFALGNRISVSTNGYISLGTSTEVTGNDSDSVTNTTGLVLAVMPRDLQQTSLHYFGDSSSYVVRWRGHQYGITTNVMEYEAKFYPGQQYADIFIINMAVTAANNFAYLSGGSAVTSYPITLSNNSRYRVNFNTTGPTSLPGGYTPRATANMFLAPNPIRTSTGVVDYDIGQTTIITANTGSPAVNPFFPFFPPFFPFFPPYFPYFPTFGGTAPATPTNVTFSGIGAVGWSHPGASTFTIEFYTAQSATGFTNGVSTVAGPYTQSTTVNGSYQLTTPYASPNNYARVRVRANTGGLSSAYSAWVPSETSYT